jgi:hypothetical protein
LEIAAAPMLGLPQPAVTLKSLNEKDLLSSGFQPSGVSLELSANSQGERVTADY